MKYAGSYGIGVLSNKDDRIAAMGEICKVSAEQFHKGVRTKMVYNWLKAR